MTPSPELSPAAGQDDLFALIGRIAHILGADHFPSGERAALKRFAPGQAAGLAYFRFWARWLQRDPPPDAQSPTWALILAGIALMGPHGHASHKRVGAALAEAYFSESRLERLLAAEDAATRRQLFARLIRFLAAKGAAIDWTEAAAWLLAGDARHTDLGMRIARDYYATKYHQQQSTTTKE